MFFLVLALNNLVQTFMVVATTIRSFTWYAKLNLGKTFSSSSLIICIYVPTLRELYCNVSALLLSRIRFKVENERLSDLEGAKKPGNVPRQRLAKARPRSGLRDRLVILHGSLPKYSGPYSACQYRRGKHEKQFSARTPNSEPR